ncbi:DgyrCDS12559 [Dimorphilus gyrociliatus]|uniref:DgyrCDS12559 n=1 Tax=Dimorphilus gyrociliatus TaxID=2664684 RepID=A0A7I8W6V1_9ANNE|nr:DgyrCDS12559 [Dimorphilus gyrociliatus]
MPHPHANPFFISASDELVFVKISGLSLELTPGIPGVPTKITPKMEQGTEVTMFYSFGDNYLKEETVADPSALSEFTHTFANGSGTYTVSVRASNKYSFEVASCTVDIDFPVGDVEFAATNVEFGETTTFSQNVTNGTRVRFFWIYGDGMGEEKVYDEYSDVTTTMYTYPKAGVYNVTLRVGNVHGYKQLCTIAAVNYKVSGLDFNVSHTKLGDLTVFNQTLVNGSHMHCLRIVGDGTVQVAYDDFPETSSSWNHTYTEVGSYTVTLRCYNYISQQSVSKLIFIENPVENIEMQANNVSRPEEDVFFKFTQTSGNQPTNLVITLLYGNTFLEITMNSTLNTTTPYTHTYRYCDYGYYMMTAKLYNHISRTMFTQVIKVGVSMNTLTIKALNEFLENNTLARLSISVDQGSTVNYTVDWGDGIEEVYSRNNTNWTLSDTIIVTHMYSTVGYYPIKVNASNTFGHLYQETKFNVQYPLKNLNISDFSPEVHQQSSGTIRFIIAEDTLPLPSNVTCKFSYAEEVFQSAVSLDLSSGPKTFTYTYGAISPGNHILNIVCENLVSNFTHSRYIWVQETITSLSLTTASDILEIGKDSLDLRVEMATGSHVNYTVTFGDTEENNTHIVSPAKPEHFFHDYTIDGNLTVNVTVQNMISSAWKTMIIHSQFKIKPFTVFVNTPISYPGEQLNVTVVADQPLPTDPTCNFKVKSGETIPLFSPGISSASTTGGVMSFYYTYDQADCGVPHEIKVTCSNKVTQGVFKTKNINLEEKIAGLTFTADKYLAAYGEDVTFSIAVTAGTNVKNIITYYGSEKSSVLLHSSGIFSKGAASTNVKGFLQIGNFTPSVNSTNLVTEVITDLDKSIVIQHKLKSITLKTESVVEVNPTGTMTLTIQYPDLETFEPTNPFCSITVGSGTEKTHWAPTLQKATDFVTTENVDDSSVGEQIIEASCFNLVSRANASATVVIQRRLQGIKVENMAQFAGVNKVVQFKVTFQKCSHAILHVDFNDTKSETFVHDNPLDCSAPYLINHTYTDQGDYTIVVTASNNLTHVEVGKPTTHVTVQFAIEKFIVTNNCPIGFPTGDAQFVVQLNKSFPMPSGVFLEWDFDDSNTEAKSYSKNLSTGGIVQKHHKFNSPLGVANVTIKATNLVSEETVVSPCSVMRAIGNLQFSTSKKYVKTKEEVVFDVSVNDGTDASYIIKFGDGNEANKKILGTSSGEVVNFSHKYDTADNYTINVEVKNDVSKVSSEDAGWTKDPVVVVVQREVIKEAIKLTFTKNVAYPKDRNVVFKIEKLSGNLDPSNAFILLNFGDGSVTEVYVDKWDNPIPISHQYGPGSIGEVNFVLKVENKVSNITIKDSFLLQREIENPVLKTPASVGVDIEFTVTATVTEGSHLIAQFVLKDSNQVEVERKTVSYTNVNDKEISAKFTVKKSEVYLMSLLVSNDISSKAIATPNQIFIENPVNHLKLKEVKVIETQKTFVPILIATREPYPTSAQIVLNWGDGSPLLKQSTPLETGEFILPGHKYLKPGLYKIYANISNNIDYDAISLSFEAQEVISDVSFKIATPAFEDVSGTTTVKPLAVGTSAIFTASYATGSNITFKWIFGGGYAITTTNTEVSHKFSVPSEYTLVLEASNDVGTVKAQYPIKVVSDVGVESVTFNGTVTIDVPETITINLDKEPDASIKQCFAFRFNTTSLLPDNDIYFWRGNSKSTCKKDPKFKESQFSEIILAQTITEQFTYKIKGTWQITLTALTETSSGEKFEFLVAVQSTPCNNPNVTINPNVGGSSVKKMRNFYKSDPIRVVSDFFDFNVDCKATDAIRITWEFFKLNKTNVNVGVKEDVSKYPGAIQNAGGIEFRKSTLAYGSYKIVYTVMMYKEDDPEVSLFRNSSAFFFEVKRTDLVAEIIGKTSILVSYNESLGIDGITNTFDPDTKHPSDKSGMKFEWWFSLLSEPLSWNMTNIIQIPSISATPTGCPDYTKPGVTGPFGTGFGKLSADVGKFKMHTGFLCPLNSYKLWLRVTKGVRTQIYKQVIKTSAGKSPPVIIECDGNNCMRGDKLNPQELLKFKATCSCTGAVSSKVRYSWDMNKETAQGPEIIDMSKVKHVVTNEEEKFRSFISVNGENFQRNKRYSIAINVSSDALADGADEMSFFVNHPPFGGSFTVNKFIGEDLDDFEVNAPNWQDDGALQDAKKLTAVPNSPLLYTYFIVKGGVNQELLSNELPKQVITLPEGEKDKGYNLTLGLSVSDSYRSASVKYLTVKVYPIGEKPILTTMAPTTEAPTTVTEAPFTGTGSTKKPTTRKTTKSTTTTTTTPRPKSAAELEALQKIEEAKKQKKKLEQAKKVTNISPSQAATNLNSFSSKILAVISSVGPTVQPVSPASPGSPGTGSPGGPSQPGTTTAKPPTKVPLNEHEKKAAEEQKKAEEENAKQKRELLGGMVNTLSQVISAAGSTTPPAGSDNTGGDNNGGDGDGENCQDSTNTGCKKITLSPSQTKAFAKMAKAIFHSLDPEADTSTKTNALLTCSSIADNIDSIDDPVEQKTAATDTVDAIASTMGVVEKEKPKSDEELAPSPKVDEPNDEASHDALLKAKKIEEEKKLKEQEQTSKQTVSTCLTLGNKMTKNKAKGTSEQISKGNISLAMEKNSPNELGGKKLTGGRGAVKLPSADTLNRVTNINPNSTDDKDAIAITVMNSADNFYSYDESAKDVESDAGVTILSLQKSDGSFQEMNLDEENALEIEVPGPGGNQTVEKTSNLTSDSETGYRYLYIPMERNNSAILSSIRPDNSDKITYMEVLVKLNASNTIEYTPNSSFHDLNLTVNRDNDWKLFIPAKLTFQPGVFIGVKAMQLPTAPDSSNTNNNGSAKSRRKRSIYLPPVQLNDSESQFVIESSEARCRAWNEETKKWTTEGCEVDKSSTTTTLKCKCKKVTTFLKAFSGGVTLPKVNKINFKRIFNNFAALLAANPTVLSVLLSILFVYTLLGIWTRRRDKRDLEKWGTMPLRDNRPLHNYYYQVSVYTGVRAGAGTKSNVCFILSGDIGDTGIRSMSDKQERPLARDSVRHYIMSADHSLGALTFLRIWHDNSGEGDNASWFLDKVVVEDIQTKTRYFFLCGKWLATEEDDGQVQRILPVADQEEIKGFKHLFFTTARKNISDEHLWLSVVSRPTKSNFTRLQRLTCCLTLLLTTMIANAMWYRTDEQVKSDQAIILGPIILSVSTLYVSVIGNLTVVPINIIIVQIFRKSKSKDQVEFNVKQQQEEKKKKALKQADKRVRAILFNRSKSNKESKMVEDLQDVKVEDSEEEDKKDEVKETKKIPFWRQRYPLPYQCVYIGWVLSFLSCSLSAFFVLFYSLEWGKSKSEKWLSSLFLSFFQSVMLIQPVKVIVIAMFMSCIFKKVDDEDEMETKAHKAKADDDEELLEDDPILATQQAMSVSAPEPPSKKKLAKMRFERLKEKKTMSMLQEACSYFVFLLLVSFIAWGTKSYGVYLTHSSIHKLFDIKSPKVEEFGFSKVQDGFKFWQWANETLLPGMFYERNYNLKIASRRNMMYMDDQASFRVGVARLRQVRVKPASCDIQSKIVKDLVFECNEPYNVWTEENRHFQSNWRLIRHSNQTIAYADKYEQRLQDSFKYNSIYDLKGLPFWGTQATYGGGGYVADLGTSRYQALKTLINLKENMWVDQYTRAVFAEWTIYNPQVNLFAYVNYLSEFPASGGVIVNPRVTAFQIYAGVGGMGTVVLVCQIIYVIVIIYFIVREALEMKKLGKPYWKDPWNYIELLLILLSIGATAMYITRQIWGKMIMNDLKDNKDSYINYMQLATYDEILQYVTAFIAFVANIKFLRLLRFNKNIAFLGATLKHAAKELIGFGFSFFVLFVAFATFAYKLFGVKLHQFHTFISTLEALYSMLLGKFDFKGLEQADHVLGPTFFVLFVVLMYLVLVNMFLGILGAAFYEVRLNPDSVKDEYKVFSTLFSKIKKFMGMNKPQQEIGSGYVDHLQTLDMRVQSLDFWITDKYKTARKQEISFMKKQDQLRSESAMSGMLESTSRSGTPRPVSGRSVKVEPSNEENYNLGYVSKKTQAEHY